MIDELPPDVSRLLASERERPGPGARARARIEERLAVSIAAFAGAAADVLDTGHAGSSAARGPALPSPSGAGWMRAIAIGATSFVVGAGAGIAIDRAVVREAPTKIVTVERIVTSPAPVAPREPEPISGPAPSPSSAPSSADLRRAATPSTPSSTGRDRELAAERVLLEVARTALGRRDPAGALVSLDRHAARYPSGHLREEREALAVQALADLDRMAEARTRAARFKERYPTSMLAPVVDAAIAPK